jgi:2-polyprenyl-3-methyl-5-hydroxy-6-metoxy-1,4-benzoquinol methylase
MNRFFILIFAIIGYSSAEAFMQDIDQINRDFYDDSGSYFSAIPFDPLLPELFLKYGKGKKILEIGSGPGGLALWLTNHGYEVTCIEPSKKLAALAAEKGLNVHPITIQEFKPSLQYDCIVAISSLIHVPKKDLPAQIKKIASALIPQGLFFVSFIEGDEEGFEDPTKIGKPRFFAKWSESDLDHLTKPYFDLLETHKIFNKKMGLMFFLNVYLRN